MTTTTNLLLRRAIEIALVAHENQLDKVGKPYVLHPLAVMLSLDTPEEMMVGVLHDVVEDTSWTLADLEREGFPPVVIEAVAALTHAKSEPYDAYIRRVRVNPLATRVKRADLMHNMSPDRLTGLAPEAAGRMVTKYVRAFAILEGRDVA